MNDRSIALVFHPIRRQAVFPERLGTFHHPALPHHRIIKQTKAASASKTGAATLRLSFMSARPPGGEFSERATVLYHVAAPSTGGNWRRLYAQSYRAESARTCGARQNSSEETLQTGTGRQDEESMCSASTKHISCQQKYTIIKRCYLTGPTKAAAQFAQLCKLCSGLCTRFRRRGARNRQRGRANPMPAKAGQGRPPPPHPPEETREAGLLRE